MGDVPEVQVTPETPGRPVILNPFESPNDYHRLLEPVVASPSMFKSSKCPSVVSTPAKFKWSIDEMASLLPVEIDPEDIQRQSLFLSRTRTDKLIEEKRQYAIEQFFTKKTIVPSPWSEVEDKGPSQMPYEINSISPRISEENCPEGKCNATCQTALSLPVDFNLQKILGDYYRMEEVSEQAQESLSSSSLRRKLFLDGNGSGSESSAPSSPEQSPQNKFHGKSGPLGSVNASPLHCGIAALTPSSGQFSSSPIQGRCRNYSLGSVTSPMLPENSSPSFKSPMLSPIVLQYVKTPLSGERKKLSFTTPDRIALGSPNINNCTVSPFVEGCSPIKSCSPVQSRGSAWVRPQYRTSPLQMSPTVDKENIHPDSTMPTSELDVSSAPMPFHSGKYKAALQDIIELDDSDVAVPKLVQVKQGDNDTVNMGEPAETQEDYSTWSRDEVDSSPMRLTSSRTGSMTNMENSNMFVSMLAEGSTMPYDSSMQVDSGYNTYSVAPNSMMDGGSSDSQTKESPDAHVSQEAVLFTKSQHVKSKMLNVHH
ncbi:protein aurora borealis isoform X1 [Brienomyrus brachyistius]|uniref:protein aurora borealis isoform X1 n=1 Tax=Brienomyrus brachyistius TaxID=42636 RepID=UPI0020B1FA8B|nr:protein aurora borealis isoform X1 [Brienomyrus brachyistius]XP_048880050.1 protein aurora borealis isoform X1 [Brienomyrus brachyistius]